MKRKFNDYYSSYNTTCGKNSSSRSSEFPVTYYYRISAVVVASDVKNSSCKREFYRYYILRHLVVVIFQYHNTLHLKILSMHLPICSTHFSPSSLSSFFGRYFLPSRRLSLDPPPLLPKPFSPPPS